MAPSSPNPETLKRTVARLAAIQSHLDSAPRGVRLKGKVAVVTGVGSLTGIGRATARLFAHEGARHLYLLDLMPDNLPDLERFIKSKYPDVKVTTLDVDAADDNAIRGICERAIKEEGRLDVFFANAGVATGNVLRNIDHDEFENTLHVNSLSCFLAVKYASAAMQVTSEDKPESGGSIVLTASVAGLRSGAGSVDYSASKAAVISLAQTSACQLARTNVRVNAVCPGLIETGMTKLTFDAARSRGTLAKVGQLNALGRFGISEEIANAVLFLASDQASYVNGVALPVDGGLTASMPVAPGKFF